ncbi:MAG: AMP nucleosidase [Parvularculaceae bacterium]
MDPQETEFPATDLAPCADHDAAMARLTSLYDAAMSSVAAKFDAFAAGHLKIGEGPPATYPYLAASVPAEKATLTSNLALGRAADVSRYGTSVTQPKLFASYLTDQLRRIVEEYDAKLYVGRSYNPIPKSFALEAATARLEPRRRAELSTYFSTPNLLATNDDVVDGRLILGRVGPTPLSLFTAERTDFSLHRIRHYTATSPAHFQNFVLFTNYQRYVDEFVAYARAEVAAGRADAFVGPGDVVTKRGGSPGGAGPAKSPQMPAYHLKRDGHDGVTLVNIGVGPSNAKTITDHLAVLRPHVWLMIGHCGGLRRTQRLGDYVLAHAYLRDDNVLDEALPPSIPLPTIAEVQVALRDAVKEVTGVDDARVKENLRTGTVVTTGDRNWELRFEQIAVRLNQSRAIAIDMESATIAANGYRYRVPYGTLLCVSDRPLHGEVKLPGMADAFYEERVSQHLAIGLRAAALLHEAADAGSLHSRKLRSFDEPFLR